MAWENPRFDLNRSALMTGEEKYGIFGAAIDPKMAGDIIAKYKGLQLYGQCLEKAIIAIRHLREVNFDGEFIVAMGSMKITWMDNTGDVTQYGNDYNPPYEFHAWVVPNQKRELIIDLALPGMILRGQKFRDWKGFYLKGLIPGILAGSVPEFIEYSPRAFMSDESAELLVREQ